MYFYLGFIIVIIVLIAIIIFKKPDIVTLENNDKLYKDSIALLQKQISNSESKIKVYQTKYDSVCNLEPKIVYRTHEKINFIITTATPDELDSIIRATWKTKSRYQ